MQIEIYGYEVNIDYTKSINEQELLKETRVILSLIYRDYLCNQEKREELIAKDKKELFEYEQKLREKYNPDNLFKNKEEKTMFITNDAISSEKAIVEYKESVFTRIKNWFKRLLGR